MLLLHVRFDKSFLFIVKYYTIQECIMTKSIQTQNNAFNFNDFNDIPHFYLNKKEKLYNQFKKASYCK